MKIKKKKKSAVIPGNEENNYKIDTETLVEVTDQLEIRAFVYEDPQFKLDTVLLKISGKNVQFNDVGFNIGVGFSPKILQNLDYKKKNEDNINL